MIKRLTYLNKFQNVKISAFVVFRLLKYLWYQHSNDRLIINIDYIPIFTPTQKILQRSNRPMWILRGQMLISCCVPAFSPWHNIAILRYFNHEIIICKKCGTKVGSSSFPSQNIYQRGQAASTEDWRGMGY